MASEIELDNLPNTDTENGPGADTVSPSDVSSPSSSEMPEVPVAHKSKIPSHIPNAIQNAELKKQLDMIRRYFLIGCFFMPVLWLYNILLFRKKEPRATRYNEHLIPVYKKFLKWSKYGLIAWSVIFVLWVAIYQIFVDSWGPSGEDISLIIRRGS